MKWLKLIDLSAQLLLTIIAIIFWRTNGFFIFYFGVGGLQVVSCLAHVFAIKYKDRAHARKRYETILSFIIILASIGGVMGWMDIGLGLVIIAIMAWAMLWVGVMMAIGYFTMCLGGNGRYFQ